MSPLKIIITKLAYFILLLSIVSLPSLVNAFEETDEVIVTEDVPRKNTVYFPQFQLFDTVKNEAEMSDEITGRLDLADECLRVVTRQGSFLIIWPGWYDFAVSEREIVVNKINTGEEVAHLKIGDKISLSGAELVNYPISLQFKIPDQCLGPFWAVGDIESVKPDYQVYRDSLPAQRKFQKLNPDAEKWPKMAMPPKRHFQQKYKGSGQSDKQMKKLEIMLEKTILK